MSAAPAAGRSASSWMYAAGNAATPPAEQRRSQLRANVLSELGALGTGITFGGLVSPRNAAAATAPAATAPLASLPATMDEAMPSKGLGMKATKEAHLEGIQRLLARPRKEVVAFLGAGFLAPLGSTFGSWQGLLEEMVNRAREKHLAEDAQLVRPNELLKRAKSSAELQRVAQVIEDTIATKNKFAMDELAADLLALPDIVYDASVSAEDLFKLDKKNNEQKAKGIVQFRKRIAMMRLLPFKAIVTVGPSTRHHRANSPF